MKKNKVLSFPGPSVVLLLSLFLMTTACQYTGTSTMKQPVSEDAVSESAPAGKKIPEASASTAPGHSRIADAEAEVELTAASGTGPGGEMNGQAPAAAASTAGTGKTALPMPKEKDQKNNIDHALRLYRLAQKMWEKGNLEEALGNLDSAYAIILDINPDLYPELNQQKDDLRYMISKRILEIYASRHIVVNGTHDAIPITMNKYVKRQIDRFTGSERNFFVESLKRSGRFRSYIESELKKAGLPTELSWLPLVESGYKIRALSPARALGLWQFIPSTGYKFGLKRNYYIDERLDPEKATQAAIAYLKELHKIFGDWTTVLAAYNCGEARVLRIIRKQKINYLDNFWDLYQRLPRETAQYVPRFLATLHIVRNLEKYNIDGTGKAEPIPYKTFKIDKQIRLRDIAKEIGTETETLKTLNPELRYALLPPDEYDLKIPETHAEKFVAKLDKIKTAYPPPKRYVRHRVRRGETLSGISQRYNTSIRAICAANNIYRTNLIVAGKVLKIPSASGSDGQLAMGEPDGDKIKYRVRRGDNLWLLARRFDTTTKRIMAMSGISSTKLHINQVLYIPANQTTRPSGDTSSYWVKNGDNPFLIAKKHNMSLNRLLTLNHLTKKCKIYPGQKLLVE